MTIEYKIYLKILQMLRSLGCLSKTSTGHHGLRFLEGLFCNEKPSTSHKTKTENSLALSFAIFVFQRCIFSLKIQNVGLENHLIVRARQPFCWKWISFNTKTFQKYAQGHAQVAQHTDSEAFCKIPLSRGGGEEFMFAKNHGSHVFPPKSGSRDRENLVRSWFLFL